MSQLRGQVSPTGDKYSGSGSGVQWDALGPRKSLMLTVLMHQY